MRRVIDFSSNLLRKILLIKSLRIFLCLFRYFVFRKVFKINKKFIEPQKKELGIRTFDHNYKNMLHSIFKHDRLHRLLRPMMAIDKVLGNKTRMKVLSIGPRSEAELFLINGYGFKWKNIDAIDLFSYSPKINVGDMHKIPFNDNSYDIIINGWCLGYSSNQKKALSEMLRVVKNEGIIAIGQGHIVKNERKVILGVEKIKNKISEIVKPINKNINQFFFTHEISKTMEKRGERLIAIIFSIKK
tara:strand:+ start:413 stop:1144 length:732 start_codon:yes stop_codon:yes gene_type:complete